MGMAMGMSRSAMSKRSYPSNPGRVVVEVVVKNQTTRLASRFGNPDPYRFKVLRHVQKGRHLIMKVFYPDCKNYEGRKILVFANTKMDDLKRQTGIDPHFSDSKKYRSPVARFKPTPSGWDMALVFATKVLP